MDDFKRDESIDKTRTFNYCKSKMFVLIGARTDSLAYHKHAKLKM